MNILKKANEIVNERAEEKERQYGTFDSVMERTKDIFNAMSGLNLTTEQGYLFMVATKLAREYNDHKEDNLMDAVAYLGGLNNYIEGIKPEEPKNVGLFDGSHTFP